MSGWVANGKSATGLGETDLVAQVASESESDFATLVHAQLSNPASMLAPPRRLFLPRPEPAPRRRCRLPARRGRIRVAFDAGTFREGEVSHRAGALLLLFGFGRRDKVGEPTRELEHVQLAARFRLFDRATQNPHRQHFGEGKEGVQDLERDLPPGQTLRSG